ncbi:LuxR family transcriptional regulator [Enterobacteriaceae bacterium 89]|nr:LuxR family transcriptional regulator [Enterobacteriaceae bacterium 89]
MIFIISKDSFFSQGIANLKKEEEVVKLNHLSHINHKLINDTTKIIIDTWHNNILDDVSAEILKKIDVGRIIICSPFRISKLNTLSPIYFINRKEQVLSLCSLIHDEKITYEKPAISLSHNQLKLANSLINQQKTSDITRSLKISEQTLRIQKFNIMLKLKLRRMSDITTLKISPYF